MFGRLLLVEPKIGLEPVVEVRGFAPRARSGDRPYFDDGPALVAMDPNGTFGRRAKETVPGPRDEKHVSARVETALLGKGADRIAAGHRKGAGRDRKSTRLNYSH